MTKFTNDLLLDLPCQYVEDNADVYTVCSQQPTTYAEGNATYMLATQSIDSSDFTGPANGDVSGRKTTVAAQNGVEVLTTGIATHYALLDSGGSALLHVTEVDITYHGGTAQAGGASTITLAAGADASDDEYNGYGIRITSGTGSGQSRMISDYVGSTKVATVSSAWATQPDNTSVYEVFGRLITDGDSVNLPSFPIEYRDPV
jgi:hypothetical protein